MSELAQFIDHTRLTPDASDESLRTLCNEALHHKFFAVCVSSAGVPLCKTLLANSSVKLAAVIGFPHGNQHSDIKLSEAKWCVENGADEIDMVINLNWLKNAEPKKALEEIQKIKQLIGLEKILKVIVETGLLGHEQKIIACEIVRDSGADFIKTCTGFSQGAATVADVELFQSVMKGKIKIKASGGIKDRDTALALIKAGALRLGTSSGLTLVIDGDEAQNSSDTKNSNQGAY